MQGFDKISCFASISKRNPFWLENNSITLIQFNFQEELFPTRAILPIDLKKRLRNVERIHFESRMVGMILNFIWNVLITAKEYFGLWFNLQIHSVPSQDKFLHFLRMDLSPGIFWKSDGLFFFVLIISAVFETENHFEKFDEFILN